MRRKVIPFFMPNEGCPGRCIYCDQGITMGDALGLPEPERIIRTVLDCCGSHPSSRAGRPVEAALFGGTFTALPVERQGALLAPLRQLRQQGVLDGIRISTHPAHVDRDVLARLHRDGVTAVELGIQSFDDRVLDKAGRRYGGRAADEACRMVRTAGLEFVIQLMPFLPLSSAKSDSESARRALALRPDGVRLFPTVVLEGTILASMWRAGEYRAVGIDEAVERVAAMLEILAPKCEIMRVGLQESTATAAAFLAGPHHPALGELCWSGLLVRVLASLLPVIAPGDVGQGPLTVLVDPRVASFLFGHGGAGLSDLAGRCPGTPFTVQRVDGHVDENQPWTTYWKCDKFAVVHYNGVVRVEKKGRTG